MKIAYRTNLFSRCLLLPTGGWKPKNFAHMEGSGFGFKPQETYNKESGNESEQASMIRPIHPWNNPEVGLVKEKFGRWLTLGTPRNKPPLLSMITICVVKGGSSRYVHSFVHRRKGFWNDNMGQRSMPGPNAQNFLGAAKFPANGSSGGASLICIVRCMCKSCGGVLCGTKYLVCMGTLRRVGWSVIMEIMVMRCLRVLVR